MRASRCWWPISCFGVLFGPWGLGLVADVSLLKDMAHIGIIFLLFLLGLHLHPQKLLHMFGEAALVTAASSAACAALASAPRGCPASACGKASSSARRSCSPAPLSA